MLINGLLASLRTGLLAGLLAAGLAALAGLAAAGFFAAAGLAAGFVTLEVEAAVAGFFSAFFSVFFSAGLPIIYKNNEIIAIIKLKKRTKSVLNYNYKKYS